MVCAKKGDWAALTRPTEGAVSVRTARHYACRCGSLAERLSLAARLSVVRNQMSGPEGLARGKPAKDRSLSAGQIARR